MGRKRWLGILFAAFVVLTGTASATLAPSSSAAVLAQRQAAPGPGQVTPVPYYDDPVSKLAYEWRVQIGGIDYLSPRINVAVAFADITNVKPPPKLDPGDLVYDVDQMKRSNPALYNAISPKLGVKKLLLIRRVNSSKVYKKFMGKIEHSEARIERNILEEKGIPWKNLVLMYSDIIPCVGQGCSDLLAQTDAKVTYSARSQSQLGNFLNELVTRNLDDDWAKIRSDCGLDAAGQPGSGDTQDMALMAFSSGDPCGQGEGTPGGLVKALTSGNLGGVDFSTLQMRYMSDDPDSTGLQYSFSGQRYTSATPQDIGSALNVLTDNAADLRTWLVLSPDEFWVNLNPSEPDRIIGAQLGQTNAGRELLDADFQLKRSSATLMNPNTTLGAQYWHDLAGSSPSVCYGSRMWIVPGQVQVREDGGSLYILNAQLAVKAVPDHVADMPASCHYDAQTDARGRRLDQTMIVPLITKMVNTAPEYAPIRRAFMARIVAQWIRDRYASGQRTSFDSLIDSGNIGPARLQDGWQPQQVFNAYVKSLQDGEFTYNSTFHQGGATYIQKITIGGVDFTSLHPTAVSAAQVSQEYPQLARTAKLSVRQLTSSDGSLWLGGTIVPPSGSMGSKVTDPVRSFASGRTGILILVLAGLGVVIFGIRRRSRRGRQAT